MARVLSPQLIYGPSLSRSPRNYELYARCEDNGLPGKVRDDVGFNYIVGTGTTHEWRNSRFRVGEVFGWIVVFFRIQTLYRVISYAVSPQSLSL